MYTIAIDLHYTSWVRHPHSLSLSLCPKVRYTLHDLDNRIYTSPASCHFGRTGGATIFRLRNLYMGLTHMFCAGPPFPPPSLSVILCYVNTVLFIFVCVRGEETHVPSNIRNPAIEVCAPPPPPDTNMWVCFLLVCGLTFLYWNHASNTILIIYWFFKSIKYYAELFLSNLLYHVYF